MDEIWKDIEEFEGRYQISNLGQVKSVERKVNGKLNSKVTVKERFMKLQENHKGYLTVILHKNRKVYSKLVHRLVASAFIPNPENKPQVNHINCNKKDNKVENLEWCTQEENMKHASIHGIYSNLSEKQKLTQSRNILQAQKARRRSVAQIDPKTGKVINIYESITVAAKILGLKSRNSKIVSVCKGERNTTGGYKWKYVEDIQNKKGEKE